VVELFIVVVVVVCEEVYDNNIMVYSMVVNVFLLEKSSMRSGVTPLSMSLRPIHCFLVAGGGEEIYLSDI
jgi:hypothetical protein